MVDRVTRFGVSVPRKLGEKFDKTLEESGYGNRSKALSDAISDFIKNKRWVVGGNFVGTVSYVYSHHVGGVTHKLTEIQHSYDELIRSTMHSHISHDLCVEVLIIGGRSEDIKGLYDKLSALRGVENCKLAVLQEL